MVNLTTEQIMALVAPYGNIGDAITAYAQRPQKTSTITDTTSTTTPYALANMLANRDRIGRATKEYDDALNYDAPDNLQLEDKSILDLYKTPLNKESYLVKNICGVEHKLAFGGLHGARENYHTDDSDGEILNVDVTLAYNMA